MKFTKHMTQHTQKEYKRNQDILDELNTEYAFTKILDSCQNIQRWWNTNYPKLEATDDHWRVLCWGWAAYKTGSRSCPLVAFVISGVNLQVLLPGLDQDNFLPTSAMVVS